MHYPFIQARASKVAVPDYKVMRRPQTREKAISSARVFLLCVFANMINDKIAIATLVQ